MTVWKAVHPYIAIARSVAIVGLVAACGGGAMLDNTGPSGTPGPSATVSAEPTIVFSPATVTIPAGGTVTFNFGSVPHDVFFDNQPMGAPANIPGSNANVSKALTFTTPGTFVYNCHIHPGMRGTVIVQ